MPSSRTASSSVCVPRTSVRMKSCGIADGAVDVRLGGEVDDGVGAAERVCAPTPASQMSPFTNV